MSKLCTLQQTFHEVGCHLISYSWDIKWQPVRSPNWALQADRLIWTIITPCFSVQKFLHGTQFMLFNFVFCVSVVSISSWQVKEACLTIWDYCWRDFIKKEVIHSADTVLANGNCYRWTESGWEIVFKETKLAWEQIHEQKWKKTTTTNRPELS